MCHRCFAPRTQYLSNGEFEVKTTRKVREKYKAKSTSRVEIAGAGGYMNGSKGKQVVRWDPEGRNVTARDQVRDRHDPVLPVATLMPMFPIRHTILSVQSLRVSHGRSRPISKIHIPPTKLSFPKNAKGPMREPLQD